MRRIEYCKRVCIVEMKRQVGEVQIANFDSNPKFVNLGSWSFDIKLKKL